MLDTGQGCHKHSTCQKKHYQWSTKAKIDKTRYACTYQLRDILGQECALEKLRITTNSNRISNIQNSLWKMESEKPINPNKKEENQIKKHSKFKTQNKDSIYKPQCINIECKLNSSEVTIQRDSPDWLKENLGICLQKPHMKQWGWKDWK